MAARTARLTPARPPRSVPGMTVRRPPRPARRSSCCWRCRSRCPPARSSAGRSRASPTRSSSGVDVYGTDEDPELVRDALPFGLKTMESLLAVVPDHEGLLLSLCRGFTSYSNAFVQSEGDLLVNTDYPRSVQLHERALKLYLRAQRLRAARARAAPPRHRRRSCGSIRRRRRPRIQKRDLPHALLDRRLLGLGHLARQGPRRSCWPTCRPIRALMERGLALDEALRGRRHPRGAHRCSTRCPSRWAAPRRARAAHFARAVELSQRHQGLALRHAGPDRLACSGRTAREFEALLNRALEFDPAATRRSAWSPSCRSARPARCSSARTSSSSSTRSGSPDTTQIRGEVMGQPPPVALTFACPSAAAHRRRLLAAGRRRARAGAVAAGRRSSSSPPSCPRARSGTRPCATWAPSGASGTQGRVDPARLPGRRGGRRARPRAQDAASASCRRRRSPPPGSPTSTRPSTSSTSRCSSPPTPSSTPRSTSSRPMLKARLEAKGFVLLGLGPRRLGLLLHQAAGRLGGRAAARPRCSSGRATTRWWPVGKSSASSPVPLAATDIMTAPADRDDRRLSDARRCSGSRCSGTGRRPTWWASGWRRWWAGSSSPSRPGRRSPSPTARKILAACRRLEHKLEVEVPRQDTTAVAEMKKRGLKVNAVTRRATPRSSGRGRGVRRRHEGHPRAAGHPRRWRAASATRTAQKSGARAEPMEPEAAPRQPGRFAAAFHGPRRRTAGRRLPGLDGAAAGGRAWAARSAASHIPGSATYLQQLTLWLAFLGGLLAARERQHLTLSTAEALGGTRSAPDVGAPVLLARSRPRCAACWPTGLPGGDGRPPAGRGAADRAAGLGRASASCRWRWR